jgi:ketosteroid isomerase-like protein
LTYVFSGVNGNTIGSEKTQGAEHMSIEEEVRKASKRFYTGLNSMANGDIDLLAGSWSHSATVTAMHPIGDRQVGWNAVRSSFEQVARLASDGKIELKDQIIHTDGDMAYEVGVEQGQFKLAGEQISIDHRVTNIYKREDGAWKMIHHHTDTSPAMMDLLRQLQSTTAKAGR